MKEIHNIEEANELLAGKTVKDVQGFVDCGFKILFGDGSRLHVSPYSEWGASYICLKFEPREEKHD